MTDKKKFVEKVYNNPDHPAFLAGSVNKLASILKNKPNRKTLQKWLNTQDSYTLHRPVRKFFQRNHYKIFNIDDLWEIDLCDLSMYKTDNDGFRYLLTVIDVFSKYAFVKCLRTKTANEVLLNFKNILDESQRKPKVIQCDRGSEFINSSFRHFLASRNIQIQFPLVLSMHKAAVVERFNRTIQTMIHKWQTHKNTNRYVDILSKLVNVYNRTIHSTIKMRPIDVNSDNIATVFQNTQKKVSANDKLQAYAKKFNVGQHVRIMLKKTAFEHGYTQNYTREIFKISQIIDKQPSVLYRLMDLRGQPIQGKFYAQELQAVEPTNLNIPMKILKTKGLGSKLEYFVQSDDNTTKWISYKDMPKVNITKNKKKIVL